MNPKFCKDCNKKISYRATYCRSCSKKGTRHPLYGKVFSKEHRKKLSEANIREKSSNWKGGKPECIDCGKQLSKYGAQRCHKCANKITTSSLKLRQQSRERWKGEKNPNWKGGTTPLIRQIRNCFKNRQWRSDIFTRDDFTCILCGQKGVRIEADHYPKMFSTIFYEYKIKTLQEALDCEELWNINNGRTLCRKCHRNF